MMLTNIHDTFLELGEGSADAAGDGRKIYFIIHPIAPMEENS